MSTQNNQQGSSPAVIQKEVVDQVLAKVKNYQETGAIKLESNYSPGNALKAAGLILQETTTKDHKPVLTACSKESIANACFSMITQGLNPLKNQGYFIAYGTKLIWQRSYMGNIALAKKHAGVKEVVGIVVHQGDEFEYKVDAQHGRYEIVKHVQKLENKDKDILGAYAIVIFKDESMPNYVELMTKKQIEAAWNQGQMNGNSPAHKKFQDQMSVKSVINRALKLLINSSDDSALFEDGDDDNHDYHREARDEEIQENANKEEVKFEDAEEVEAEEVKEEQRPQTPEEATPTQMEMPTEETTPESMEENTGNNSGPGF